MKELERYWADIPVGRENAITYIRLEHKWGMSERRVRMMLAELSSFDNGDNYILIRSSAGRGFYLSDDPAEIAAYKRECRSRAVKTFAPLKKINRVLADLQPEAINYSFTNNLKIARKAAGLTQDEVCDLMRELEPYFDKSKLSRLENSYALPTPLQLLTMARIYGCEPSELVEVERDALNVYGSEK